MNCVGLAPDGRMARFPALGPTTGDWGGGADVGMAALMAAARSADGRGQRTVLEQAIPAYFGMAEPFDVARAIHLKELNVERLGELPRVVFAAAEGDPIAATIVDRLGDEVVAFATAAMRRLGLLGEPVDVVLGGGLLRAVPPAAVERIAEGVRRSASRARVTVAPSGPIVGAVLLGLDELGINSEAFARARTELSKAFVAIEGEGVSDG
jgi:N-acetylglucosamine kinase-like BadF-type ATPase